MAKTGLAFEPLNCPGKNEFKQYYTKITTSNFAEGTCDKNRNFTVL